MRCPRWLLLLMVVLETVPGQQRPEPVSGEKAEVLLASCVRADRMRELARALCRTGLRQPGTPSGARALGLVEAAFSEARLPVRRIPGAEREGYEVTEVACELDGRRLTSAWPLVGSPALELSLAPVRKGSLTGEASASDDLEGAVLFVRAPALREIVSREALRELRARGVRALCVGARKEEGQGDGAPLWVIPGDGLALPLPVISLGASDAARMATAAARAQVTLSIKSRVVRGPAMSLAAVVPGKTGDRSIVVTCSVAGSVGSRAAGESAACVAVVAEMARALWVTQRYRERTPLPCDVEFVFLADPRSRRSTRWAKPGGDGRMADLVVAVERVIAGRRRDCVFVGPRGLSAPSQVRVQKAMAARVGRRGFWGDWSFTAALAECDPGGLVAGGPPCLLISSVSGSRRVPSTDDPRKLAPLKVDDSPVLWTSADLPRLATDREPQNMEACARAGLVLMLRLAEEIGK